MVYLLHSVCDGGPWCLPGLSEDLFGEEPDDEDIPEVLPREHRRAAARIPRVAATWSRLLQAPQCAATP